MQASLIPSLAATIHFSALAFLGAHKFDKFINLMLFNLIIIVEPIERRSIRSRKPKVHFDDQIAQSLGPSKSSKAPKALPKPIKPTAKSLKPSPIASTSTEPFVLDIVEDLCSQIEGLYIEEDLKAKKKAKAAEIARLKGLGLDGVLKEARPLKDVQFEPFDPGLHREPKVNISPNIDPTDPLALLDLFIPPKIYATIAENTNLYAIAHNAPIAATPTNRRYWWPTNENEIRVLFGVLFYMGVYKEPNYRIYWEAQKLDGPSHAIPKHLSLNRYENLCRYLHVSPLKRPNSQMET